jgi:hypothetical protein
MIFIKLPLFLILLLLLTTHRSFCQQRHNKDYLLLVDDSTTDRYGYKDQSGRMVIPFGKYPLAFTDTFRTHAIVLKSGEGYVAIDQNQKVLYHIFTFDNGPDYPAEDLYRIVGKGKIGYANLDGKIVITPQFACAYPFESGKAKVSMNCTSHKQGDHSYWESAEWLYIDKKGKRL